MKEPQIHKHLLNEYPDYQARQALFKLHADNEQAFILFAAVGGEWDYHPNGSLKGLNKLAINSIIQGLKLTVSSETYQQLLTIERVIKNHIINNLPTPVAKP